MIQKYHSGNLVWVDLFSPTIDEIRQVVNEYNIHPLVAHELNIPTLRPKVDLYDNFIYLILHFPSLHRNGDGGQDDQEVDFIMGGILLLLLDTRKLMRYFLCLNLLKLKQF
jgi:magnesium transporter